MIRVWSSGNAASLRYGTDWQCSETLHLPVTGGVELFPSRMTRRAEEGALVKSLHNVVIVPGWRLSFRRHVPNPFFLTVSRSPWFFSRIPGSRARGVDLDTRTIHSSVSGLYTFFGPLKRKDQLTTKRIERPAICRVVRSLSNGA